MVSRPAYIPPFPLTHWAKIAVIIVAIALVPVLIWLLSGFILVTMGAIMVAILMWLGAEPFYRWLKLPTGVALALSGVIVIATFGGVAYLFGTRIGAELQDVFERIATAQKLITAALKQSEFGRFVLAHVSGSLSVTDVLTRLFSVSMNFLEALVVCLIAGMYIAAQPQLYRDGLLLLLPPRLRQNARETLDDVAIALRLWLLGQLLQMVIIGLLSTLAAFIVGLPSPLALGLIAGVAEFIPYIGPILAAIPAVLVAATKGLDTIIWTLASYLLIHQIEGNLVAPLIQRYMIYIPPAVVLLGLVAITYLLGTTAIIFATPIEVVLFVLVKKLYVRDSLKEATELPGERH